MTASKRLRSFWVASSVLFVAFFAALNIGDQEHAWYRAAPLL